MITVKGSGGMLNAPPTISEFKSIGEPTQNSISISYKVTDADLQIVRHYITVKTSTGVIFNKKEITKEVGYENPNNIFSYTINGLKRETSYTIQITCSDGFTESNSIAIQQKTEDFNSFGFVLNESIADPKSQERVKYIDGAVGIPPASVESGLGEWENHFPFKDIKMFGYQNGVRTKEINKNNKKLYIDGTPVPPDVDVFTRFPKIWVTVNKTGSKITVKLSKKRIAGSRCCAHFRNSKEYNYLNIATYRASQDDQRLRSSSSNKIGTYTLAANTDNIGSIAPNIINVRKLARNYNQNAELHLWSSDQLLKILYILAFKSTDKEILGNCNNAQITGSADEKGFIAKATSSTSSVFLGIEDIWGISGGSAYIDGISMFQDRNGTYTDIYYYLNINNKYSIESPKDWLASYQELMRYSAGLSLNPTAFLENCTGRNDIPFYPENLHGQATASTYYTAAVNDSPGTGYARRLFALQDSLFSLDWSKTTIRAALRLNLFED